MEARSRGIERQLVAIATGGGKTEIFSRLGEYHDDIYPMLVLAHREELLEQAKFKIERANPDLRVDIEMGSTHADAEADVVCASVATIGRSGSARITKFAPDYFKTVVVDEAHHAAATTYKNVLNYFDSAFRIGFTATPKRADNVRLDDVFDEIVFEKNMIDLIREGYLSQPIPYRFTSSVDLSEVNVYGGDYAVGELSNAVNVEARHEVCVQAYEKVCQLEGGQDTSTIVFCVDVAHAQDLAAYFTRRGYPSQAISGQTPNREEIIDAHKRGEFKILTNCMVAVEGYDDPSIRHVIMARPTKSDTFYAQAVGRGARLDGTANIFYVSDIVDATRGNRPISIPSLMGMPPGFDADGEPLEESLERFEKLKEKSPSLALTVTSLDEIDAAWEKIDLFTPPPVNEALLEYSRLLWMEVGNEFLINVADVRMKIDCDQLGVFRVYKDETLLGQGHTLASAFNFADNIIKTEYSDQLNLLDTQAPWRSDPPTDKQIKHLKKFNVPYEHLSKGEASQILDKLFKDNPRKPRPAWVDAKIRSQKYGPSKF